MNSHVQENSSLPSCLSAPNSPSLASTRSPPTIDDMRNDALDYYNRLLELGGRSRAPVNLDPGPWIPSDGTARNQQEHEDLHWQKERGCILDDFLEFRSFKEYQQQKRCTPGVFETYRNHLDDLNLRRRVGLDLTLHQDPTQQSDVTEWKEYLLYHLERVETAEVRLAEARDQQNFRASVEYSQRRQSALKAKRSHAKALQWAREKVKEVGNAPISPSHSDEVSASGSTCACDPERWQVFCKFKNSSRSDADAFDKYKAWFSEQVLSNGLQQCHDINDLTLIHDYAKETELAKWTEYLVFETQEQQTLRTELNKYPRIKKDSSVFWADLDLKRCWQWVEFVRKELPHVIELSKPAHRPRRKRQPTGEPIRFSGRLQAKAEKLHEKQTPVELPNTDPHVSSPGQKRKRDGHVECANIQPGDRRKTKAVKGSAIRVTVPPADWKHASAQRVGENTSQKRKCAELEGSQRAKLRRLSGPGDRTSIDRDSSTMEPSCSTHSQRKFSRPKKRLVSKLARFPNLRIPD